MGFTFFVKMLLTIDIGNSTTKFGIFENARLANKFAIKTMCGQRPTEIFSLINGHLPKTLEGIVISSVVEELNQSYYGLGNEYFSINPHFVKQTFDFGFSVNYNPPENCGVDRLVAAYSAKQKYSIPCIVCDFGTATTIDLINKKQEYLGGIITPGVKTLASALFEKTSGLPKVEPEKPDNIIGNSTKSSIQSGIYFGYIGLVDGIIGRMIQESGEIPEIVSTGGFAAMIAEESEYIEIVEDNLILEGLRIIHENRESK